MNLLQKKSLRIKAKLCWRKNNKAQVRPFPAGLSFVCLSGVFTVAQKLFRSGRLPLLLSRFPALYLRR